MEWAWADGSFSAAAVALRQRQSNGGAERTRALKSKALRWRRWNEADEIIMILLKKDEKST